MRGSTRPPQKVTSRLLFVVFLPVVAEVAGFSASSLSNGCSDCDAEGYWAALAERLIRWHHDDALRANEIRRMVMVRDSERKKCDIS